MKTKQLVLVMILVLFGAGLLLSTVVDAGPKKGKRKGWFLSDKTASQTSPSSDVTVVVPRDFSNPNVIDASTIGEFVGVAKCREGYVKAKEDACTLQRLNRDRRWSCHLDVSEAECEVKAFGTYGFGCAHGSQGNRCPDGFSFRRAESDDFYRGNTRNPCSSTNYAWCCLRDLTPDQDRDYDYPCARGQFVGWEPIGPLSNGACCLAP